MPKTLDLELGRAAYVIVHELFELDEGESLLITIDSAGDWRPAEEVAKAAEGVGAKVMVAWHSTPPGYGKVADPGLPDSLKAAIPNTDCWLELNNQWILYSTPWDEATKEESDVRYMFMGGLDAERLDRCVGKINWEAQEAFQSKLVQMTKQAQEMRIENEAGTDVSFENKPRGNVTNELRANEPGAHFLTGQIGWSPKPETIEGRIVFDGSLSGGGKAELGVLETPIELTVDEGRIVDISGGEEAEFLADYLEELDDPNMYRLAHVCYGFNPGAKLTGLATEDERVWGSTEWGFGHQGVMYGGGWSAASHIDGICLNSTVYMDGEKIIETGAPISDEISELANKCKENY